MQDDYEGFDELGADTTVFLNEDWDDVSLSLSPDAPWMAHISEGDLDDVQDHARRLMIAGGFGAASMEHSE